MNDAVASMIWRGRERYACAEVNARCTGIDGQ